MVVCKKFTESKALMESMLVHELKREDSKGDK